MSRKTFRELLHRIAQATIPYLQGANRGPGQTAVQLFDTWCGELKFAGTTKTFALPAVQEIIAGLGGSVPVIYYTKGVTNICSPAWRVSGRECTQRRLARGPG